VHDGATLVVPDGSRILDEADLGGGPSVAATLIRFLGLLVAGVVACPICWELGMEQRPFHIPSVSGMPAQTIMVPYLPDPAFYLGLGLLFLPPAIYLVRGLCLARPGRLRDLARRARDRWRARLPVVSALAEAPEDNWIRVRGQVVAGAGFTSASGRANVVLAAYLGCVGGILNRGGRARVGWELHGVDFDLALESGEHATVRVDHATLLERPARFPASLATQRPLVSRRLDRAERGRRDQVASVYDERVLAPGDWVEVIGLVRREVDPAVEAGPRGVRLRSLLVSTASRRVLIAPAG